MFQDASVYFKTPITELRYIRILGLVEEDTPPKVTILNYIKAVISPMVNQLVSKTINDVLLRGASAPTNPSKLVGLQHPHARVYSNIVNNLLRDPQI